MISNYIFKKAQLLEVSKVFENDLRIDFVVGNLVTFHKKYGKFTCNCTGHVVYNIGGCSAQVACALKGEGIPKEIKERVEEEVA